MLNPCKERLRFLFSKCVFGNEIYSLFFSIPKKSTATHPLDQFVQKFASLSYRFCRADSLLVYITSK